MRLLTKIVKTIFVGLFSLFIVSCGNNKFPGFKTMENGVNIISWDEIQKKYAQ
jgi:hypothetical protein